MREDLKKLLDKHLTPQSGAIEAAMMIFGAFITIRELARGENTTRAIQGAGEMLFGFTVGLPLGNAFWQRASVILFPMIATAQIETIFASEYLADEARLSPDDPRAAELRRKAAQCMGGVYSLLIMFVMLDRGLGYVQQHGRVIRDEAAVIFER